MRTLTNSEYRGKKAKVGGLCFDENDRMYIFVAYCPNCRGKVVMSRKEAEQFTKCHQCEQNKLRTRLFTKMADKRYIHKQPEPQTIGTPYYERGKKQWWLEERI